MALPVPTVPIHTPRPTTCPELQAKEEDSLSDIERFYARYQIRNLDILHDRDHLAFSQIAPAHPYYGVRSTPTTVLVDPRGNYISAYSGVPGWEKPEGVALLKWIIDNA